MQGGAGGVGGAVIRKVGRSVIGTRAGATGETEAESDEHLYAGWLDILDVKESYGAGAVCFCGDGDLSNLGVVAGVGGAGVL